MSLRLVTLILLLAAIAAPFKAVADGCVAREASVLIRGDEFKTVPLQIRSGTVRIGALEFVYVGEEIGWKVSRSSDKSGGEVGPPTQITMSKEQLEIRSLDRRTETFNESPDAVLTAETADTGTEIRIAAKGEALVEVAGKERRAPASKELAVGCGGISLFVALGVL